MKRFVVYLLLCSFALSAAALVEGDQVMYAGGTIPNLREGAIGHLDTTSETVLTFEASGTKLVIPYAKMDSFEYKEELARHLGVVATIVVVMAKHRQRRHFFRISFHDDHDVPQVAVLEVSKEMPRSLKAVLQARAPKLCKPVSTCSVY